MIDRIDRSFEAIRKENRAGLVGYLTAGDPDYKTSLKNILSGINAGIDILELGVPFSDPTADGPVIQAASQRALASGMTVKKVLSLVRDIRSETDIPVILFGYANPFFRYGYEKIAADAAEAGADGLLVVDLPYEESEEASVFLEKNNLAMIPLVAPTTPPGRMKLVLSKARGFVYYIMVTGVTGKRTDVAEDVKEHVDAIRQATPLPIAAGFGISNGAQAGKAASSADAIVVGSALVEAASGGRLADLVREIASSLKR